MNSTPQPNTPSADLNSSHRWIFISLVCLALLLFVRNPYVVLHPQFWHEDAIIFLVEQRTTGLMAIFHPYAGYFHTVPRLVAAVAALFPLEYTPHLYLLGAYIGWIWVGGLILTSPLFRTYQWAAFAAIAWVAVPHGGEVFLILTNTQWALAVGLTLLLAEDEASRGKFKSAIFVALAALSGAQCTFLIPIAVWRLWRFKRSHAKIDLIALLALLGGAIQLAAIVSSSSRVQESTSIDLSRLSFFLWVGIFPELFGTKGLLFSDFLLRITGTLIGILGLGWATWDKIPEASTRRQLLLGAGLILGGALFYIVATKNGAPMAFGGGQRYLFIPFALYTLALISAWSYCPKTNRSWLFGLVLLAIIAFHSSERFFATPYKTPDWNAASALLRSGQAVEIQVGPFGARVIIPPDKSPNVQFKP